MISSRIEPATFWLVPQCLSSSTVYIIKLLSRNFPVHVS